MTKFAPHQQRVLDEKQDLDLRISRLDEFMRRNPLYASLDAAEQARMTRQLDVMRELSVILGERIEAFGAAPIALPVVDPGADSLEREIQAKANKAPRVTPADIEAEIVSEH